MKKSRPFYCQVNSMILVERLGRHLRSGALEELTLTTNGSQLAKYALELAAHGVRRINVSVDTLDDAKFKAITRCAVDDQRDADAAPVLCYLAQCKEIDFHQHGYDHQPDGTSLGRRWRLKLTIEEGTGPLIAALPFSRNEYAARLARLRDLMRQQSLEVFVSFSPENIFWLTGHDSPAYHYVQASVVTLDDPPVNVLRRIDATNTLLRSWSRRVVSYEDSDEPMEVLADLIEHLAAAGARIGVETDSFFVSARRFDILRKRLGQRLVSAQLVEPLRLVKSVEELSCIRKASRLTKAAMETAVRMAREGVNENHIAGAVWNSLVSNGSEFPGLPPFIVSGPRTSLGHATWAGHTLQKGDPVVFEIPGVINRYVAPQFRSGSVGEPSAEMRRLEAAVVDSLALLIREIRPGAIADDVHRKSVESFARHGYKVGHRSGYSVGINYAPDWGEGNLFSLVEGETRPFEAGMVFHLVPGIYVPPEFVVVISETVVVTETGAEVITDYPRRLFTC